ncbi:hypothetical protein HY640_02415 [Candidatus Woesearchaeota archaeon]|nr:hypothetical protein [Candidatus Woesearchaeota archaeon]
MANNDDEKYAGEDREPDIYDEEMDEMEEEDELSPEEEGFIQGYEEGEKMSKCPKCGKVIVEDFVEKEIEGEIYRFCSNHCAETYKAQ